MAHNPVPDMPTAQQTTNGDTAASFALSDGSGTVVGLGSFHKTLPHNDYGEVVAKDFAELQNALLSRDYSKVLPNRPQSAQLTNPRAGLAKDRLVNPPNTYVMPAAPRVLSDATAAEMTELYWMALLRDLPFNLWHTDARTLDATIDINAAFNRVLDASGTRPADKLWLGVDAPGAPNGATAPADVFTPKTLFRLGLPGEEVGPMLSQFFMRPAVYGTQTIDARQRPYKAGKDYLTRFDAWLHAQNTGRDAYGQDYSKANENSEDDYEAHPRYISTLRDLARFVNKDALHQAYFNAALLLLSGGGGLDARQPVQQRRVARRRLWRAGRPAPAGTGLGSGDASAQGRLVPEVVFASAAAPRGLWRLGARAENRRDHGRRLVENARLRIARLAVQHRSGETREAILRQLPAANGLQPWQSGPSGLRRWARHGGRRLRHHPQGLVCLAG